jgi:hypothetical protein
MPDGDPFVNAASSPTGSSRGTLAAAGANWQLNDSTGLGRRGGLACLPKSNRQVTLGRMLARGWILGLRLAREDHH